MKLQSETIKRAETFFLKTRQRKDFIEKKKDFIEKSFILS